MNRLSLKIDYAFKRFFITRPDLLIDFLNAVFEEYDRIKVASLEILNPELPGEAIEDKNSILDIRARDDGGNTINIEMQAHFRDGFAKRSAFYAFRLYITGIKKGEDHSLIPPIFSINLIDFDLFPGVSYHRCFRLLHPTGNVVRTPLRLSSLHSQIFRGGAAYPETSLTIKKLKESR